MKPEKTYRNFSPADLYSACIGCGVTMHGIVKGIAAPARHHCDKCKPPKKGEAPK